MYIFVFIFRGILSEISESESLAELEVNVVGDKSASGIFIFRFPVSRAGKNWECSLLGTLNTLNPADSIDPRKTVDSQPQCVVVRKIHTPSNGLLVYPHMQKSCAGLFRGFHKPVGRGGGGGKCPSPPRNFGNKEHNLTKDKMILVSLTS